MVTQEEKEYLKGFVADLSPCICHEAYKSRKLIQPDCLGCNYKEEFKILSKLLEELNG